MIVKKGNIVKFHYSGKFDNGEVFNSSKDKEPAVCEVGKGRLIRGLEEGLVGMKEQEKKEVVIPADKGYGPRDQNLVMKMNKNILGNREVKIGQIIKIRNEQGKVFETEVLAIEADIVTLDFNHPLAGKTLKFDIEILEIQ